MAITPLYPRRAGSLQRDHKNWFFLVDHRWYEFRTQEKYFNGRENKRLLVSYLLFTLRRGGEAILKDCNFKTDCDPRKFCNDKRDSNFRNIRDQKQLMEWTFHKNGKNEFVNYWLWLEMRHNIILILSRKFQ